MTTIGQRALAVSTDTDGEIDIVILDMSAPLNALPDGIIALVRFEVAGSRSGWPSGVRTVSFSQDPKASFGSTEGTSIKGIAFPPAPHDEE